MKVLVVEDESRLSEYLQKGLREEGFIVDAAADGVDGLHLAEQEDYDVVLVDVMLPRMDGWALVQRLRASKPTPVLFLTARDDVNDKIRGLELGGDDYLTKPFSFAELVARIRTLLRRGPVRDPDILRIGDLVVDVPRRKISRRGQQLTLTAKEFALLHLLARKSGTVLTRSIIASQVWDINFDSDTNVVDVAIRRLRAKIDDPFGKKLLHTVRGVGYVLEDRDEVPST